MNVNDSIIPERPIYLEKGVCIKSSLGTILSLLTTFLAQPRLGKPRFLLLKAGTDTYVRFGRHKSTTTTNNKSNSTMSSNALHAFLVNNLGIEAATVMIVVDNATTTANANRTILCGALETMERSKGGHDSAPLSPRRTRSKLRLPDSPHVSSAFEQQEPKSPMRHSSINKKKGQVSCLSPSPAAVKSPSRWESNVAIAEEKRSPPPRQPKRILSSNDLLNQSCTKISLATTTRTLAGTRKTNPMVASISALPLFEMEEEEEDADEANIIATAGRPNKATASPSPIGVRDFCCSSTSDEQHDLLAMLNASFDDLEIFED